MRKLIYSMMVSLDGFIARPNGDLDAVRLMVQPVVLGTGRPMFRPTDRQLDLRLVETHRFGSGVVYLHYERR